MACAIDQDGVVWCWGGNRLGQLGRGTVGEPDSNAAPAAVPEPVIGLLYANAYKALAAGGRLIVHDFMVDDSLDGPPLGALWALQHVTVNAQGRGLCPSEVVARLADAGFGQCDTSEMSQGRTKRVVAHKA